MATLMRCREPGRPCSVETRGESVDHVLGQAAWRAVARCPPEAWPGPGGAVTRVVAEE